LVAPIRQAGIPLTCTIRKAGGPAVFERYSGGKVALANYLTGGTLQIVPRIPGFVRCGSGGFIR
jgi:hypothetical protein